MVRGRRRKELEEVCKQELKEMDKRIWSGDVLEATMALSLDKSKQSKL